MGREPDGGTGRGGEWGDGVAGGEEEEWEGRDFGVSGDSRPCRVQVPRVHIKGPGGSPISSTVTVLPKQETQRFSLP